MRLNTATFTNEADPRVAHAVSAKLLAIESQLVDLLAGNHEETGCAALLVNDMRTLRARLAPAASFMTTTPTMPEFLDPARHL